MSDTASDDCIWVVTAWNSEEAHFGEPAYTPGLLIYRNPEEAYAFFAEEIRDHCEDESLDGEDPVMVVAIADLLDLKVTFPACYFQMHVGPIRVRTEAA